MHIWLNDKNEKKGYCQCSVQAVGHRQRVRTNEAMLAALKVEVALDPTAWDPASPSPTSPGHGTEPTLCASVPPSVKRRS